MPKALLYFSIKEKKSEFIRVAKIYFLIFILISIHFIYHIRSYYNFTIIVFLLFLRLNILVVSSMVNFYPGFCINN